MAQEPSGSVEVVFEFDSTALEGKLLVVFESLEYGGKEIAAHADINDDAQTVGVGVRVVSGGGAKTGRDGLPFWILFIAAGAGIAAFCLYRRYRKKPGQIGG